MLRRMMPTRIVVVSPSSLRARDEFPFEEALDSVTRGGGATGDSDGRRLWSRRGASHPGAKKARLVVLFSVLNESRPKRFSKTSIDFDGNEKKRRSNSPPLFFSKPFPFCFFEGRHG
jgi:hypothetical protein